MTDQISVAGAAIVANGRALAAQRGPSMKLSGYWEFPGGKIELGETPESALVREIGEELNCSIRVGPLATLTRHSYEFGTVLLRVFWASLISGAPTATEHAELRWCNASELEALDWAPADIPAAETVAAALGLSGAVPA